MNTDTTKRYRLLKELPDSKVGDIYTWNDTFNHYYKEGNDYGGRWHSTYVENNPEWFEEVLPVSEPVKVNELRCYGFDGQETMYQFSVVGCNHKALPLTVVKDAVEKYLNNDTVVEDSGGIPLPKDYVSNMGNLAMVDGEGNKRPLSDLYQLKYTQSEVDTIRKELEDIIEVQKVMLQLQSKQPTNDNAFVWTDELVILLCDFVHHNGWHKNGKRIVEEFDEFKSINPKKRIIPNWIKQHLQSKQSPPLSEIKEGEDKPVLFTTEDGVKKYQGEMCWYWDTNKPERIPEQWFSLPNPLRVLSGREGGDYINISGYKYFSTKEAAEQYILLNKPKSLNS